MNKFNETNKLKSRLLCGIAAFATQIVIFFGLRSVALERHMNSAWNFIMFVLSCLVLAIATLSSKKILMAFAATGYPIGFIIGTIFNRDSLDPGGGLLNNWWIVWTVTYLLIVLIGIIIEIIVKKSAKKI